MITQLRKIFTLIVFAFIVVPAYAAQEKAPEKEVSRQDALLNEVKAIEETLKAQNLDITHLGKVLNKLTSMKANATECITETEKNLIEKKTVGELSGRYACIRMLERNAARASSISPTFENSVG